MSFPVTPNPKRRERDFEINKVLGHGNFVTVFSAVDLVDERRCALKVIDRNRCFRLGKVDDVYMERHCLRRVNHVNIIKMFCWFSDNESLFISLEECARGELWEEVKWSGCPENLAKFYLAQIMNGLVYLRQARIVHRDLKGENVLLSGNVVKIIDFGTAKDLENPQVKGAGNSNRRHTFHDYVGTPQFMPPEVIENKCTDFRSDTWSLGCLIYQIIAGIPPFHARAEYFVYQKVIAHDLRYPPGISDSVKDLVNRMVVKEADERLGAHDLQDVKDHPFLAGVVYEDAHKRAPPLMSLADLCLRKIARGWNAGLGKSKALEKEVPQRYDNWKGVQELQPALREAYERIRTVAVWTDDATPPRDDCD